MFAFGLPHGANTMEVKDEHIGLLFIAPALLVLLALVAYPIIDVILLSLHKVDVLEGFKRTYIGLQNYINALSDSLLHTAFINTLEFVIGATVLEVLLGLLLATIFSIEFRGRDKLVPLIIVPMMLPIIVISSFWRIMYHTEFGIINALLKLVGLPPVNWLGDTHTAMLAIIIVDVWQYTPFAFLIIYAGIQSIPPSIIDAALVDGASLPQIIRHIVLPLVKRYILVVAMLRIIDTFRIFDKVFALTGGGPGSSTEVLSFVIYKNAFRYYEFGYAASQAVIMLATVLAIVTVYLKIARRGEQT